MSFVNDCLVSSDNLSLKLFSDDLLDEYGFLRKNKYNQNVKTLSDISELPGMILVAECGIGKSYIIDKLKNKYPQDNYYAISLSMYQGDASGLIENITNISSKIKYVFIDGIDEATELIVPMLRSLSKQPSAYQLFIASRNIPQIKTIQSQLSLPIYSLLPLSRENVLQIAEEHNVNGTAFIEKVISKGLSPVCAKPLGCKLLLNAYKENELGNTNSDFLWKQSILTLCAENDSLTKRLQQKGYIPASTCFEYVAKIALILKLSGKSIINNISSFPVSHININFSLFGEDFSVEYFNEILSRGLFLPIGIDCFRFAHISYFDYLAAVGLLKYVNKRHWESILLAPDKMAIYPQWEGAAAWLASFDVAWQRTVLNIQPELLLVSDEIIYTIGAHKLCAALIERSAELDFWRIHDPMLRERLFKLKSPDIIPILKKAFDNTHSVSQKEMATAIIRECALHELEETLVSVFNNPSENLSLRKMAGYALSEFASSDARIKCKKILSENNCSLDLKGVLFKMSWPDLISIQEIAPHLDFKDRHAIDAYDMWLTYDCPQSLIYLSEQRLLDLLQWSIESIYADNDYYNPIFNLKQQIFTICWKKYHSIQFYSLLAQGFLAFQRIGRSPFADQSIYEMPEEICYTSEMFRMDRKKREELANLIIKQPDTSGDELTSLPTPVLDINDLDYILERIDKEVVLELQEKWVVCFRRLQYGVPLPEFAERWDKIHEKFPNILTDDAATAITKREESIRQYTASELAQERRREINEEKERLLRNQNILAIKKALAVGNASKLFYNIINFFQSETSTSTIDYRESNIWKEFSSSEIKRLTIAAKDFLREVEIPDSKAGSIYPAYPRAFYLLLTENPEEFKHLPQDIWKKFSRELLKYSAVDDKNILSPIFEHFASNFPRDFKMAIVDVIMNDVNSDNYFNYEKFRHLLREDICIELIELCKSSIISNEKKFKILNEIKKSFPNLIQDFLRKSVLSVNEWLEHCYPCISILVFDFYPDRIKELIIYIEQNPLWGKAWLENIIEIDHYEHHLLSTFSAASPEVLGRLYIWLHKNYPSKDQPQHKSVYIPTNLDNIYNFITQILNAILEHQTVGVVIVLQQIYQQFPQDSWMKEYIIRAKKAELKILNPIYSVDEIKKIMGKDSRGVLINSPEDLLNLVLECLREYQTYLTGKENPRVEDLWNLNKTSLTHKSEEDFSDHIKAFLDLKMKSSCIIINREVQLNRGINGTSGARTDLWVNVYSRDRESKYSLCIEVKGSWNTSAPTAIKEQLVDKYMGSGGADAGIYLVGWFDSKKYPQQENMWNNDREWANADLDAKVQEQRQKEPLLMKLIINCDYRI